MQIQRSRFLTTVLVAAAVFGSSAAMAEPVRTNPKQAQTDSAGLPTTKKPTRYCIESEITGSHIRRKTCRTRAEWMRHGVDPLELR